MMTLYKVESILLKARGGLCFFSLCVVQQPQICAHLYMPD